MSFSVDVLAGIAIELQSGIGHQDRFQRLITTLRQVLECDASALLRYESRQFIPLAIDGLAQDVLGIRVWRRLPAPGTWFVSLPTAICQTRMMV